MTRRSTRPARYAFLGRSGLVMLAVALAGVACLLTDTGLRATASPATAEELSWLAAGDSFSSGEGIPRTSGDCAQSQRAFGPRAAKLLDTERDMTFGTVAFTACTGAVATEFFNRANKSHPSQTVWAAQEHAGGVFDVATISFGGNDVDFGAVMKRCLDMPPWEEILESGRAGCDVTPDGLASRVANLERGIGSAANSGPFGPNNTATDLAGFFAAVANRHVTEGGSLVIAGYPRLIAPSNQWPAWRKDRCGQIGAADADMLGNAAVLLDEATRRAVKIAQGKVGNRSISYVSRLSLFDGNGTSHSLCSKTGTSWMNGVASLWYAGRFESPFHPNEIGHLKTAERVAAEVAMDLQAAASPTPKPTETLTPTDDPTEEPTEEEVISDGESGFQIGDSFSAECSVAWPTAPSYTPTTIELTTFCNGVPGQFQFVHVSYPDPDLPIDPNTGFSRVEGTIVNIAVSEYGFKTLYVHADTYILDVR